MKRMWLCVLCSVVASVGVRAGETSRAESAHNDDKAGAVIIADVERVFVTPLRAAEAKRARYSRAAMPAQARRVRVPDARGATDANGNTFVTFVVDVRPSGASDQPWRAHDIDGCIYPATHAVFIKRGSGYRSGNQLIGKAAIEVPDGACTAAPSPPTPTTPTPTTTVPAT